MNIAIIAVLTIIAALATARIIYVCWFNSTLKKAQRAMRKADHYEQMAELVSTNSETCDEYFKARLAYRRAARLFLALGKRSSARFAVYKAVEMTKLYEKYLYM